MHYESFGVSRADIFADSMQSAAAALATSNIGTKNQAQYLLVVSTVECIYSYRVQLAAALTTSKPDEKSSAARTTWQSTLKYIFLGFSYRVQLAAALANSKPDEKSIAVFGSLYGSLG